MRKGGGKQKGAAFERLLCKQLSLWLSNGKREDLLWRSAMSGGRSTVALRADKKLGAQAGDISSIDKFSHKFINTFMVEAKAYQSLEFQNFIKGTGKLIEFWKVAKQEAKRYGKLPMLVGKQNNHPIIVCLSRDGMTAFSLVARVKVLTCDLNIVLFDDFLKTNPRFSKRARL